MTAEDDTSVVSLQTQASAQALPSSIGTVDNILVKSPAHFWALDCETLFLRTAAELKVSGVPSDAIVAVSPHKSMLHILGLATTKVGSRYLHYMHQFGNGFRSLNMMP